MRDELKETFDVDPDGPTIDMDPTITRQSIKRHYQANLWLQYVVHRPYAPRQALRERLMGSLAW